MAELLLALLVAHLVADYPLQGEFLAGAKWQALKTSVGTHALTAHAGIQGGVCALAAALLGYPWLLVLGVVAVTHWLIDLGKILDRYGLSVDQALHALVLVVLAGVIA